MSRKCGEILVVCIGLAFASYHAIGQEKKVYRWVDEDGVVHYSDELPDDAQNVETKTLTPSPPPPAPPTDAPSASPPEPATAAEPTEPIPAAPKVTPAEAVDITQLSLAELDRRCDAARQEKIAPLREAEIAGCKADRRNDPDWCERFYADYGEGGRTQSGTIRPRMFDDLPECVDALRERNRRRR